MSTGESDYVQSEDISVVKWRDRGKKSVVVVSSMHNPKKERSVLRTNKRGVREPVNCPESIADYNTFMGGVDKFDQLMSSYSIAQKSRRWWLKLFYYFIDMSIVNSFIMYKDTARKQRFRHLSHLEFRSQLVNELIGNFCNKKRKGFSPGAGVGRKKHQPGGYATVQNATRLSNVGDHLPQKQAKYRRCAHCSTKAKERRSNMICPTCDVGLCKECFQPFHLSR